ncbi:hypothetical protein J437_LFUL008161 [Ladona fulva]|uniref:Uncharacterized protein n=1 Tax=Ladona fulva TaxID=123851 RepID=A0A8K0PB27_LADFU|nr:hypothetical protein J437_LFUL008161 [Ladona fulva]
MDSSPWKRPDEVMRLHRLKLKKKALQARITRPDHGQISNNGHPGQETSLLDDISHSEKRKNPFKIVELTDGSIDVLQTCEEASGITGYVRCMNTGEPEEESNGRSLDTSPNARFHQCTLYWHHPSLPWLPLFPRTRSDSTKSTLPTFAMDSAIKDCLHQEW